MEKNDLSVAISEFEHFASAWKKVFPCNDPELEVYTPQPLYNSIAGIQSENHVS